MYEGLPSSQGDDGVFKGSCALCIFEDHASTEKSFAVSGFGFQGLFFGGSSSTILSYRSAPQSASRLFAGFLVLRFFC